MSHVGGQTVFMSSLEPHLIAYSSLIQYYTGQPSPRCATNLYYDYTNFKNQVDKVALP